METMTGINATEVETKKLVKLHAEGFGVPSMIARFEAGGGFKSLTKKEKEKGLVSQKERFITYLKTIYTFVKEPTNRGGSWLIGERIIDGIVPMIRWEKGDDNDLKKAIMIRILTDLYVRRDRSASGSRTGLAKEFKVLSHYDITFNNFSYFTAQYKEVVKKKLVKELVEIGVIRYIRDSPAIDFLTQFGNRSMDHMMAMINKAEKVDIIIVTENYRYRNSNLAEGPYISQELYSELKAERSRLLKKNGFFNNNKNVATDYFIKKFNVVVKLHGETVRINSMNEAVKLDIDTDMLSEKQIKILENIAAFENEWIAYTESKGIQGYVDQLWVDYDIKLNPSVNLEKVLEINFNVELSDYTSFGDLDALTAKLKKLDDEYNKLRLKFALKLTEKQMERQENKEAWKDKDQKNKFNNEKHLFYESLRDENYQKDGEDKNEVNDNLPTFVEEKIIKNKMMAIGEFKAIVTRMFQHNIYRDYL